MSSVVTYNPRNCSHKVKKKILESGETVDVNFYKLHKKKINIKEI
jgi:glutaredoxin